MLTCFRRYDIRGQLYKEFNASIAYWVGQGYATYFNVRAVVVGGDLRYTTTSIKQALIAGLLDAGVDVFDIGICGTEEVYFATFFFGFGGGLMVTASHNPIDYNGIKLVKQSALPISSQEMQALELIVREKKAQVAAQRGVCQTLHIRSIYVEYVLSLINYNIFKPFRVVVNVGHSVAAHVIDAFEAVLLHKKVPLEFIKIQHNVDPYFRDGVPNPILEECQLPTQKAVLEHQADLGIAFDGDFDRCFFFDELGQFIDGYYVVGLLAGVFLKRAAHANIVYDSRLIWNTLDQVSAYNGSAVRSQTGHSFFKETMRGCDAVYGGEMSAHHYFRDFAYCDSGMLPWLLMLEWLSYQQIPLSRLLQKSMDNFPCSGEINFQVKETDALFKEMLAIYAGKCLEYDRQDGLSMSFSLWRFNLRSSGTEALLRLNVETRGDKALLHRKTKELETVISKYLLVK